MKRKVIQIAGSTQLVSLPRPWCVKNNIKKGQEVEVNEDGSKIVITTNSTGDVLSTEIDISNVGAMAKRIIESYYRAGIDKLKISYNNPILVQQVHESLESDIMVGVEIVNQGADYCVLRYVAGTLEEFDSILRRIFLLLVNMADDTLRFLREGKYEMLKTLDILEKTNNRMTSFCRRILNKNPSQCTITSKIGPIYTIVEVLEKLADEYKYLSQNFSKPDINTRLSPKALDVLEEASLSVRLFYELFYKFDVAKLDKIKAIRNNVIV